MANPSVSNLQAKKLAGKSWMINGNLLRFADYGPGGPGEPPWRDGAEGLAYPLHSADGTAYAYAKFFLPAKVSIKRVRRTKWLVNQQMGTWALELGGAPRLWVDTHDIGRPDGIGFDFACSLAQAVPGRTWLEVKGDVERGDVQLDVGFRERCVRHLLKALVHLEQRNVIHGDLSPNNIIVDVAASPAQPALCLIDFDGFVAPAAGHELRHLTAEEGGTLGTQGYCPPDLELHISNDNCKVAPYSDRYARDMLLIELLCYDQTCGSEDPACNWPLDNVRLRLSRSQFRDSLAHLSRPDVVTLREEDRPTTASLAKTLGIPHPPRMKTVSTAWVKGPTHPTSAFPGFNMPHPVPLSQRVLEKVVVALWLGCVSLLGVVCVTGVRHLGSRAGASIMSTLLRLAAQGLFVGGAFIAGIMALTNVAFASDRPQLVKLGRRLSLRIPARRKNRRSEHANRIRITWTLLVILFALGVSIVVLQSLN